MPGRWLILVAGLLLTGSACAHGGGGGAPEPVGSAVLVEVTNNYELPIEIYAVVSGMTDRMGTVLPGTASRFIVPQTFLGAGGVELQAHPEGPEQPFRSDPLLLAPGAIVDFVITPALFNSTCTLRQ